MSPKPVVFLGPSLRRDRAATLLDADYRPPIKRGDLADLIPNPPQFIGIVDGEFFQSLSVSTKEILPLLDCGVTILGASSMGALRAVETCRYGMIGVGQIFRMYLQGEIDGDDEVAVTYSPETYQTLSEPLVNYRIALAAACDEGIVTPLLSSRLIRRLKRIYFPDRTERRFWHEAGQVLPGPACELLQEYFRRAKPDAKAEDAAELLTAIGSRI